MAARAALDGAVVAWILEARRYPLEGVLADAAHVLLVVAVTVAVRASPVDSVLSVDRPCNVPRPSGYGMEFLDPHLQLPASGPVLRSFLRSTAQFGPLGGGAAGPLARGGLGRVTELGVPVERAAAVHVGVGHRHVLRRAGERGGSSARRSLGPLAGRPGHLSRKRSRPVGRWSLGVGCWADSDFGLCDVRNVFCIELSSMSYFSSLSS